MNDAPVCEAVTITTDEDTAGETDPDCTDVDGDTLTYTVTAAANGTSGFAAGKLTYTPDANFNGSDSFTYTANDGAADSNAAGVDVTVNAVNDAPVCEAVTITTDEDTAGETDPDCTDVDGDTLTYTVTAAANGTSGFAAGKLTYTPDANFNGSDSFTYTANDGAADSNAAGVDVTVNAVNDAPVCEAVTITTDEDTAGETDPDCTDVDGDTLTYSVTRCRQRHQRGRRSQAHLHPGRQLQRHRLLHLHGQRRPGRLQRRRRGRHGQRRERRPGRGRRPQQHRRGHRRRHRRDRQRHRRRQRLRCPGGR